MYVLFAIGWLVLLAAFLATAYFWLKQRILRR